MNRGCEQKNLALMKELIFEYLMIHIIFFLVFLKWTEGESLLKVAATDSGWRMMRCSSPR